MPIGSKKFESMVDEKQAPEADNCCGCGGSHHLNRRFGKTILMTFVGVLIVYLTFYVGALMRNEVKKYNYIGQAEQMERMITINGTAKVTAINNIAVTTVGYTNIDSDVGKAQAANKKVMDQVYDDLKKMGIEEKDLQSNYTIYPEYDYSQKSGSVLKGYRVTSQLTIKIRDLSKISDVLNLAGKYNANQVSGLSFTIDDTENLKSEARQKALLDAKRKALVLASQLGIRLGEVISYNDYDSPISPVYSYAKGYGMGGAAMDVGPAEVSGGSQDINVNVSVTFKIYPSSRW